MTDAAFEGGKEFWAIAFFALIMVSGHANGTAISENPIVWGFALLALIPVTIMQATSSAFPLLAPFAVLGLVLVVLAKYQDALGAVGYMALLGSVIVVWTGI